MSKPAFAMSMYASKADLFEAKANYFENELKKLRDEVLEARDLASAAGSDSDVYMPQEARSDACAKELALDEVLESLNKVLGE